MEDFVPRVVDLYQGDRVTSFKQAAESGIWGIIHKATTGKTGQDSLYAARRDQAEKAGLLWGAYHWGTNAPVADQVENFLHEAQPDANTLVALDYEKDKGHQMSLAQAREFLERLSDKLGRKPVLYSGNLIKEQLDDKIDTFFGSHRLWLAEYGRRAKVQGSWNTYWLWQYAGSREDPKINQVAGLPGDAKGNLDCNRFDRDRAALRSEWAS